VELTPTLVAAVAAAALVLALLALVALVLVLRGQWEVRRAYAALGRAHGEDVLSALERHVAGVAALRADVADLRAAQAGAVSRVATVRYDAFADMGGRLSYSTALLDEHGDGVVLTSINGRTDTRAYAKPVTGWESAHTLSEEERSAIAQARSGGPRGGAAPAATPVEVA
jgi:hypothetical protein